MEPGAGDELIRAPRQSSTLRVTLLADLEEFINAHRPHGTLTGDGTEPAWNGYLLTVACPCGVVFERWVTPEEAGDDRAAMGVETLGLHARRQRRPSGPSA